MRKYPRWGTRADSEQRIIDTYQEMKKEGVKISKTSLSKRVGISRETISRRYKDLWQDLDT
jgi:DNA-binding Lrp family transcriptional regulator